MKQKDFALILVIAFVAAIISIFVSKIIFVPPKNRQQQVEVVQAITENFPQPDTKYFNNKAFDPTKTITIGDGTNAQPFSNKTR